MKKKIILILLLVLLLYLFIGCSVESDSNLPDFEQFEFEQPDLNFDPINNQDVTASRSPFLPSNQRVKTEYRYGYPSYYYYGYTTYSYDSTGLRTIDYYALSSGTYGPLKWSKTYTQANYRTVSCEYESSYYGDYYLEYLWDSYGNHVTRINKYRSNDLERYWTFTRDSSGKITTKEEYDPSGTKLLAFYYTYNSDGELSYIASDNVQGSGVYKYLAFYYDSDNTLINTAYFSVSNGNVTLGSYTYFLYYDGYMYRVYCNASGDIYYYIYMVIEEGYPRYTPYDPLVTYNYPINY